MKTNAASLTGHYGLLAAIIYRATKDLRSETYKHRVSAARYFTSPLYKHHMEFLGLDPALLPPGAKRIIREVVGE